jgi:regulator of replication initiation timing
MSDRGYLTPKHSAKLLQYLLCDTEIAKYFFENLLTEWENTVISEIAKQFPEAYNKAIALYVQDLKYKLEVDRGELKLQVARIRSRLKPPTLEQIEAAKRKLKRNTEDEQTLENMIDLLAKDFKKTKNDNEH